jgi:hypothetical protein
MEEASAVSVLAVGGAAPSFLRSLRTLLKIFLTNCVTSLSAAAAAQARLRSILSKLAAAPYLGSWVTRPGFREAACATPSLPERLAKSPTDPSMGRGLPLTYPLSRRNAFESTIIIPFRDACERGSAAANACIARCGLWGMCSSLL